MLDEVLVKARSCCIKLKDELLKHFEYVSVLGEANKGIMANVSFNNKAIADSDISYGYVVKAFNGKGYSEYAFSYIDDSNYLDIAKKVIECSKLDNLKQERVSVKSLKGEKLEKDFERINPNPLTLDIIFDKLNNICDSRTNKEKIVQGIVRFNLIE